jgi:6-pyruvoyltetrahydropterin/6-carboxytetrahydropterin synthase
MRFQSTKYYPHSAGFSCAFRQWRADSHCKFLHGYPLAFKFVFEGELDVRNWVVDFGGLKPLKVILEENFDHKVLVAVDDPEIEWFREGHKRKILELVELPHCGMERVAEMMFEVTEQWLSDAGFVPRVKLVSVEVSEHDANSAVYTK